MNTSFKRKLTLAPLFRGVVPFASCEIDDHLYAVVNANAFEGVEPSFLCKAPASLEGEDVASLVARRKRNWIADVRINAAT